MLAGRDKCSSKLGWFAWVPVFSGCGGEQLRVWWQHSALYRAGSDGTELHGGVAPGVGRTWSEGGEHPEAAPCAGGMCMFVTHHMSGFELFRLGVLMKVTEGPFWQ